MLLRTQQAGPVIRTPIFLVLFLAPVFVPLKLLTGWIETVARLNPFTAILEAARGFLAGIRRASLRPSPSAPSSYSYSPSGPSSASAARREPDRKGA